LLRIFLRVSLEELDAPPRGPRRHRAMAGTVEQRSQKLPSPECWHPRGTNRAGCRRERRCHHGNEFPSGRVPSRKTSNCGVVLGRPRRDDVEVETRVPLRHRHSPMIPRHSPTGKHLPGCHRRASVRANGWTSNPAHASRPVAGFFDFLFSERWIRRARNDGSLAV
jgi:hypothetical protein